PIIRVSEIGKARAVARPGFREVEQSKFIARNVAWVPEELARRGLRRAAPRAPAKAAVQRSALAGGLAWPHSRLRAQNSGGLRCFSNRCRPGRRNGLVPWPTDSPWG